MKMMVHVDDGTEQISVFEYTNRVQICNSDRHQFVHSPSTVATALERLLSSSWVDNIRNSTGTAHV